MSTDLYFYGDPPFHIPPENHSEALMRLALLQTNIKLQHENRIDVENELTRALSKLSIQSSEDEHRNVWFTGISKTGPPKGLGEVNNPSHCRKLFKEIGPLGKGVFSFIDAIDSDQGSDYVKYRFEGDEFEQINMNVAIYDDKCLPDLKKLTEKLIKRSITMGAPEDELQNYIKDAVINHVMNS